MLKKLTLLATVLVMTTGLAQATPKSDSVVELTAAEMDTVSAGRHRHRHHRRFTSSRALAGSRALALGRRTAAATRTITAAAPGISESISGSMAVSSSR